MTVIIFTSRTSRISVINEIHITRYSSQTTARPALALSPHSDHCVSPPAGVLQEGRV